MSAFLKFNSLRVPAPLAKQQLNHSSIQQRVTLSLRTNLQSSSTHLGRLSASSFSVQQRSFSSSAFLLSRTRHQTTTNLIKHHDKKDGERSKDHEFELFTKDKWPLDLPPTEDFEGERIHMEQQTDKQKRKEMDKIVKGDERVNRVLILHPTETGAVSRSQETLWRLQEAISLCHTLNWEIVDSVILPMRQIQRRTFFGKGKLEELEDMVLSKGANLLYINAPLNASQQATLSELYDEKFKVLDRFGLVLDIFSHRAHSREAKLQIELASLQYKKSSLIHLYDSDTSDVTEQQRGGTQSMSGYGETKLEMRKRLIHDRERRIKKELEEIQNKRNVQRLARKGLPVVAVVGYTNAGKSALINQLTGAELESKNQVFTSIDPHMRGVVLPSGQKVILVDTVGFISDLPKILYTAFKSTLEEVTVADLILHVRDINHVESDYQKDNVLQILEGLKLNPKLKSSMVEVWNKIDLVGKGDLKSRLSEAKRSEEFTVVPISAKLGDGCDKLITLIDKHIKKHLESKKEKEDGKEKEKESELSK